MRRRAFLAGAIGSAAALAAPARAAAKTAPAARVAITLDLEMSRNFPRWEDTHWDFEKGNLDEAAKRATLEICRRVKAQGGRVHCFLVGRVLEQESVEWLAELIREGHPIGNHSYDHINVTATRAEDLQFRFQRAPWLLRGRAPAELIRENIAMTSEAMKTRLGAEARGFRTPGGFADGLEPHPSLQRLLLELGFRWVSSKYPAHPVGKSGVPPGEEVFAAIVEAQARAQPFVYPSGLVELPMSPISDVTAFRGGRWKLEDFLEATRRALAWVIERGAVFDFLAHPSCLGVVDPDCRAVELICGLVKAAGDRAKLVDLDTLAHESAEPRRQ